MPPQERNLACSQGGQLKPMFLGVNFINGIGEPALQGTNFTKEGGMEGEFVTRIGGGAD